jgi:cysteine desulfurase
VDFSALGVDMMTVSAHKMGGPPGVAALIVRRGLGLPPMLRGGGQESNRRAGTENVAAIAGFAKAVEMMDFGRMGALRAQLRVAGCALREAGAQLLGTRNSQLAIDSLPNTLCLAMPGVSAETQLIALDLEGVMVSAGSACTSGRIEPSHVLRAMGVPEDIARCAIRVSGGWNTTEADVQAFAQAWKKLAQRRA